jgi:hypothetical protein
MTTCKLSTCAAMVVERDIDTLLCYYNALVDKLNSNTSTDADKVCLSELATQINSQLQGSIGNLSSITRNPIEVADINNEIIKLMSDQDYEDSTVLKDMYKSNAIIWLIVFLIILIIYILI